MLHSPRVDVNNDRDGGDNTHDGFLQVVETKTFNQHGTFQELFKLSLQDPFDPLMHALAKGAKRVLVQTDFEERFNAVVQVIFNENLPREIHYYQECWKAEFLQVHLPRVDVVHESLHGGLGAALHGDALGLALKKLGVVEASSKVIAPNGQEILVGLDLTIVQNDDDIVGEFQKIVRDMFFVTDN